MNLQVVAKTLFTFQEMRKGAETRAKFDISANSTIMQSLHPSSVYKNDHFFLFDCLSFYFENWIIPGIGEISKIQLGLSPKVEALNQKGSQFFFLASITALQWCQTSPFQKEKSESDELLTLRARMEQQIASLDDQISHLRESSAEMEQKDQVLQRKLKEKQDSLASFSSDLGSSSLLLCAIIKPEVEKKKGKEKNEAILYFWTELQKQNLEAEREKRATMEREYGANIFKAQSEVAQLEKDLLQLKER